MKITAEQFLLVQYRFGALNRKGAYHRGHGDNDEGHNPFEEVRLRPGESVSLNPADGDELVAVRVLEAF